MLQRKGIAGYNTNVVRVTADYFARVSGAIARAEHGQELKEAIEGMRAYQRQMDARGDGGNANRMANLTNWAQSHYDYLLQPGDEYASIRSAGFFVYLGFNAKSAIVNLTQLPLVTQPYLAARYSEVASIAALTEAMNDTRKLVAGGKLDPELLQMWEELKARHIIDEGMTTMLAGLANDRTLMGMSANSFGGEAVRGASV